MKRILATALLAVFVGTMVGAPCLYALPDDIELEFRIDRVKAEIARQEKTVGTLKARFQELRRRKQELQEFVREEKRKIELLEQHKAKAAIKPAEKKARLQKPAQAVKPARAQQQEEAAKRRKSLKAQKQEESRLQAEKLKEQSRRRAEEKQARSSRERQLQIERTLKAAQRARCKKFAVSLARLQKKKDALTRETQRLEAAIRSEEAQVRALERTVHDLAQRAEGAD
ncbi:MAG: hypothetical protein PHT59_03075 [Candidatus Omnitrophica bacterium]|nr:hypothetical protein [Candidatus Omnitrophota bacterium]